MFTGIVTDQGKIIAAEDRASGRYFKIATAYDAQGIDIGASISCNGCCLTVTELSKKGEANWFAVEAWAEALHLTNAANWQGDTIINLERSLKHGDEYGGHMVSGHVDGQAQVIKVEQEGDATRFTLKAPDALAKFIVPKGSVTLDGTSLTVNGVDGATFDVLIIRHTLQVTTWGQIAAGDGVNIEVDQIARYVVSLMERQQSL
ncbi:MAG: riboflavin synthase [Hyphomicrobiales bacterium]